MLDPEMTRKVSPNPTIANGTSLSTVIVFKHRRNMLIFAPAAWTAADITFAVCDTLTGTFVPLTYGVDGAEATAKCVINVAISLDGKLRDALELCPYIKIRSGTAAVPVNQGAAREFRVVVGR